MKNIMKKTKNTIINLPSPSNISLWWNFGSLLGMCLTIQMTTGIFLSMFYCPNVTLAFDSTINICQNINYGWMIRTIHSNGTSMFFICMYLHIARGIYFSSYKLNKTWMSGTMIFMLSMMTAFLGYVLPWGQMSFWGATVITNFLSTIPYIGNDMMNWIWGSFNIDNMTLNRFFSFHFITPFIILVMVLIHLMLLHQTGSNNPLGTNSNIDKIPFHPYFTIKDLVSVMMTLMMLTFMVMIKPYTLNDPDNFTPANPMVTPTHIQPEWYFLFAYSILRSIPNKLGGVLALVMSIMILLTLSLMNKKMLSSQFYPLNKIISWALMTTMMLLTWLSTKPIEDPFTIINQIMTLTYFITFPLMFITSKMWDMIMFKK